MKKICYIVGAGEIGDALPNMDDSWYIIAADGGLKYLETNGIVPNMVLGDFDSYGKVPDFENLIRHKPEKDDTDMMLAVKEALNKGAQTIVMSGGLGGRIDHSVANLQTLLYIAQNGAEGFLVGNGYVCIVIENSELRLSESLRGYISVFAMNKSAKGVTISDLKYTLNDSELKENIPLGVSNEFIGKMGKISVRDGSLLVICQDKDFSADKYVIKRFN